LHDLPSVERGELGSDFAVSLGAPLHALDVGGEGRIGGKRRIVKHLFRQHPPVAIVLDADEDIGAIAALERTVRRNRGVRETHACGGLPPSNCSSGTAIQSAMESNIEIDSSAPTPVRSRAINASRID